LTYIAYIYPAVCNKPLLLELKSTLRVALGKCGYKSVAQFGLVNGIFVLARCFESRRGLVRTLINAVGFMQRTKNGTLPLPQPPLHSKVRTVKIVLTVCFLKTESGNEPVRQWLRDPDPLDRKTIGEDVKTVQIGWPLGMPLVRKLGSDL
jgi:hypothetical protein